MKKYKFVGEGVGVPGLPHTMEKSEGDQLIKDYEDLLKANPESAKGHPGGILKGALANGNYKAISTGKPKASYKPVKEKEND